MEPGAARHRFRTTGPRGAASTVQPTRNFAILALAIDGAVNAIDHTHQPTTGEPTAPPGASAPRPRHRCPRCLVYPAHRADIDTRLANDLATLPTDNATQQGILVGRAAAQLILNSRAHDGADSPAPPYAAEPAPGRSNRLRRRWLHRCSPAGDRSCPSSCTAAISSARRRRPPSIARTTQPLSPNAATGRQDEHQSHRRPNPGRDVLAAPIQNYWNAIADQVALAHGTDLDGSAYLFTQLDTTLADATIALYDAKYTYQLWRPVTAIRQADTDQNDGTAADVTWEPLANTPADPSIRARTAT